MREVEAILTVKERFASFLVCFPAAGFLGALKGPPWPSPYGLQVYYPRSGVYRLLEHHLPERVALPVPPAAEVLLLTWCLENLEALPV